jgi:hypothetical protein
MRLQPFDIVCVQGNTRVSRAIRWATGDKFGPAEVSHVAFIVEGGDLYSAVAQEALIERRSIVRRPLGEYAGTGERVGIYRPVNLDGRDIIAMSAKANETAGRAYGYRNVFLQLVDALLTKALHRPVFAARRFTSDATQECSHNVSAVFQAAGKDFGVDHGFATPESIFLFCVQRDDLYISLRPLLPVPRFPRGVLMQSNPEEAA